MSYYRRKYYRKRETNDLDILLDAGILLFLGLLGLYLYSRSAFWSVIVYVIAALLFIAFLLVLRNYLRKRKRGSLIDKVQEMGLKPEVDNFIASFGLGQDRSHSAFEYRNYRFDWHRIEDFMDLLEKKGLKLKQRDFLNLLRDYIQDREYKRTVGGSENLPKHLADLSGTEFEKLLYRLFEKLGYVVEHTGHTGDQGGDLIIQRGQDRIVVQAKAYKEWHVGNDAVQQVVAAKNFYNCNSAIVITTNDFTKEAFELAKSNNVKLVSGRELQKWILDNLGENWV